MNITRAAGEAQSLGALVRQSVDEEEGTKFLNVDLEVFSRSPLDPLIAAFGKKVDILHVGKWGRRYTAHLEVAGSGYRADAERLIGRFVAMVKALSKSNRELWDRAQSRDFNLGIETASRSRTFELRLDRDTLAAVAGVKGSVVITVYAPDRLPADPNTPPTSGRPPNKAMEPAGQAETATRSHRRANCGRSTSRRSIGVVAWGSASGVTRKSS